MLYLSRPEKFEAKYDVVSCLIQWSGRFLFLLRHPDDTFGNLWGIPTGKKKPNETIIEALKREVLEETGIILDEFKFIHTFYVIHDETPFTYHLFNSFLKEEIDIQLNSKEHVDFRWCTLDEALQLPLVPDMQQCLLYFKGIRQ